MPAHFDDSSSKFDSSPYAAKHSRDNQFYHESHNGSGKKRGVSRRALIAGGICMAAVATVGAASPAMASGVIDDLKASASTVSDLLNQTIDAVKSLDFLEAHELALQTSTATHEFESKMQGGLWDVAECIPIIGEDVKAARSLVSVLSDLVDNALLPLTETLSGFSLDTLISRNYEGALQINISSLQVIIDAIQQVMPTVSSAVNTIEGLGDMHIPQLAQVVDKAKEKVSPLMGKVDKLSELLTVFPNLLGAQGERVYVVMALNNVEIRSLAGFAGQCCRVVVNNGAISLGDVSSIYTFIPNDEAALVPLTDEEYNLYGNSVGYMAGNTDCIPDYPRVCDIWNQLWYTHQGEYLNGIVSLDPIFLQMLMALTPGADMFDGSRIDGTNTARVLMHDTYWKYMGDSDGMDAYFAAAANAALDCIIGNVSSMSASGLMKAVNDAINEYHVYAWFADSAEEAAMEELGVSGAVKVDATDPELGIYVNNETWSKMEWWLNLDIEVSDPSVDIDGSRVYSCVLTASNTATWDEINAADGYIIGTNEDKYSDDDILDRYALYAPAGGTIEITSCSSGVSVWEKASYKGLQVQSGQLHSCIDNPAVINFTVTVPATATKDLAVRMTPTVQNYR